MEIDTAHDSTSALAEIRLETGRVEVRLTRAAVKARLFGRPPESTQVGRFVVLQRVGMGGMGIVYAAYDPQLDRRVALKVMRDDVVRPRRSRHQQQLLREARAMAKISHPNVVAVYDAGTVDGQVFVTMEFVEATTLRGWLDQARGVDEVLEVFEQAGRGLATAHAAGLVHRDFKPENVLVSPQGAVKVTDFGLARPVEPDGPAWSTMGPAAVDAGASASVWAMAGTPAYMSPQQLRGEPVDARADQWAFCVALFEALAGHNPLTHPDRLAMQRGEAITVPPLPDEVVVPARLRAALGRGLSLDPADRFADMDALLRVLRPLRRSRGPRWAAVAAVVTAMGGGLLYAGTREPTCPLATARFDGVWDPAVRTQLADALVQANPVTGADTWQRVQPRLEGHVHDWLELRRDSCRAAERGELSAELLDLRMACLDTRHVEIAALLETLSEPDADIVAHAVESSVRLTPLATCRDPRTLRELTPPAPSDPLREPVREIRRQIHLARALRRAGKAAAGLERIEPAVGRAEALGDPTVAIEARLERGRIRAELSLRDEAVEDFDAVIERGGQARYLSAVAEASVALVDVVGVDLARLDAGLDLARTAAVAVAVGGDATLVRARLHLARGRVLYVAGRTAQGLEATRRGMEALEALDTDERARLEQAEALLLLAKLALARGDLAGARQHAERALTVFEALLGPAHPQVAASLAHAAAAALRGSQVDQARALFERAAEIQRRAYGPRHPDYGRTVANLGSAQREAYDYVGALQSYRQAVDILEHALGPDDLRVSQLWINIGAVEFERGEVAAAQAAYQRGLKGLRATVDEDHPLVALALANVGRLELANGQVQAARRTLERALELRQRRLGPDHVDTARSRLAVADALVAAGDNHAAVEAATAGLAVLVPADAWPTAVALGRVSLAKALWNIGERTRALALVELARPRLDELDAAELDAWCEGRCVPRRP